MLSGALHGSVHHTLLTLVAAQQHWAQLGLLPPNSFFSLLLGFLLSHWLLYFLLLEYQSAQSSVLAPQALLHLHPAPWRSLPVFQLSTPSMGAVCQIPTNSGLVSISWECLLGAANISMCFQLFFQNTS